MEEQEKTIMKKKMIALLAGALMMISAGSAFAAFTGDDLIRVVYNTASSVEAVADLGSIATLLTDASGTVVGNGGASFLNNGITSGTAGNIGGSNVAYFALSTLENGTAGKYLWVSGSSSTTTPSGIAGLKWSSDGPTGVLGVLIGNWNTSSGGNNYYQGATSGTPSYYVKCDATGGNVGSLAGFMNAASAPNTEAGLAALATGGSVTQGLWYFAAANSTTAAGALALDLQTNADGSTTIINPNVASTPIPPSFFLMGSGLLGMFGLRRKQRA
jgi:hypothetical protein